MKLVFLVSVDLLVMLDNNVMLRAAFILKLGRSARITQRVRPLDELAYNELLHACTIVLDISTVVKISLLLSRARRCDGEGRVCARSSGVPPPKSTDGGAKHEARAAQIEERRVSDSRSRGISLHP